MTQFQRITTITNFFSDWRTTSLYCLQ